NNSNVQTNASPVELPCHEWRSHCSSPPKGGSANHRLLPCRLVWIPGMVRVSPSAMSTGATVSLPTFDVENVPLIRSLEFNHNPALRLKRMDLYSLTGSCSTVTFTADSRLLGYGKSA